MQAEYPGEVARNCFTDMIAKRYLNFLPLREGASNVDRLIRAARSAEVYQL